MIKKNNCAVVILGQSFLKNYVNLNKDANLSLCNKIKYSSLIIFRPNPFTPYTNNLKIDYLAILSYLTLKQMLKIQYRL
jgi:hypothetical protein